MFPPGCESRQRSSLVVDLRACSAVKQASGGATERMLLPGILPTATNSGILQQTRQQINWSLRMGSCTITMHFPERNRGELNAASVRPFAFLCGHCGVTAARSLEVRTGHRHNGEISGTALYTQNLHYTAGVPDVRCSLADIVTATPATDRSCEYG